MKSNGVLWGLISLNVLLLMIFLWQSHPNVAMAQTRNPSDYLMVPGEISGGPTEIVYIVDCTNGALGAVTYDDGSKSLQLMPAINLNAVYDSGIGGKVK